MVLCEQLLIVRDDTSKTVRGELKPVLSLPKKTMNIH
jgi:hypothetical protein